jgi:hypothetical protein
LHIKWEIRCQKPSAFSFFIVLLYLDSNNMHIILRILFPNDPHLTKYFHEAESVLKSYCAVTWPVKKFLTFYGFWHFIILLARAPPPTHQQGWGPVKHFLMWLFLSARTKLQKATIGFIMSVHLSVICLHGTTQKPLDRFSQNLVFWQEQRVLYMKTDIHFWWYLAQFFLEWKMFQTKFVE